MDRYEGYTGKYTKYIFMDFVDVKIVNIQLFKRVYNFDIIELNLGCQRKFSICAVLYNIKMNLQKISYLMAFFIYFK